jgi:hypothetical protein
MILKMMTMTTRSCTLLVALVSVLLATAEAAGPEVDFGMGKWVNAHKKGYFNPKLEVRRIHIDGGLGIFAKEIVEEDELIAHIPWSLIIGTDEEEDDDIPDGNLECGTVRNLAKEFKLGDKSKYAPYVRHLLSVPDGQIPSAWSDAGKALLVDILGGQSMLPPFMPVEMLEDEWVQECDGEENDAITIKAAELVMQRHEMGLMVPLYDLIEHRNGDYTNTKTRVKIGKYHKTLASRSLKPGEQLFMSHDLCEECSEDAVENGYGTAGMCMTCMILVSSVLRPCFF